MKKRGLHKRMMSATLAAVVAFSGIQMPVTVKAATTNSYKTDSEREQIPVTTKKINDGYELSNGFFKVTTGKYGQITSLQIVDDLYPTNYVMNTQNAYQQDTASHQWMGELMFKTKVGKAVDWSESMTSKSDSARKVELKNNQVIVTYENATEAKGIKDFKVIETYTLEDKQLKWDITVENTNEEDLEIGDFGLPLPFNEYWPGGEEIYETRVVDHTFIGKDGSYIYATRPSGLGQFLLMTPDTNTGAGFEYQDHWRVDERSADEKAWCQDQNGWSSGLSVYYIHSKVVQATGRGYLENTSLILKPGESKTYGFHFNIADDEKDMKSTLYQEGLVDAVAVPGMTFSKDMPAKMYLHADYDAKDIDVMIKCPHELKLYEGLRNSINNDLPCKKDDNSQITYLETKEIDGEKYHVYDLAFSDLGQNDVVVTYDHGQKETELQFYIMDSVVDALNTHSDFMVENTQWDAKGELYDKVFDDWMMDTKSKRGAFSGYWGWGDDWGLTHGEFIAEKNVYVPVEKEIKALDEYLNVAIWNGLMQEHQEDYLIHDFQMPEPNTTPTYRGYAYPHIYNTYFSMYKIATKYPDMVAYIEDTDTYLLRAYNILKALYKDGVAYNWETGVMGELTTPAIIQALKSEGYYKEANEITEIMAKKYNNFKNTKYPYGSEYSYDNTGEEAVYTLAKLNLAKDTENANKMMEKINAKTRACRGLQPVWYHYANPTTICGESWWNFQYTAALAGYCMDDYLRLENNGYSSKERALSERVNYAAKLANLTCINSGQIDADAGNIGTVAWTYQSELGNFGGQGTGEGKLHNGWRQMAGEADLGLFGVLQILSADVAHDPVFGLFGYGCKVNEDNESYEVTPLDGLQTRLEFIDEQIYITLDRDQYTKANVLKDGSGFSLMMKNLEETKHSTQIDVSGLKDGNYDILVDGKVTGSFQAKQINTATISVPLPQKAEAKIEVKEGQARENVAPIVSAGTDKDVYLPSCNGIENATISVEMQLAENQKNNTRLFEFGDMDGQYFYVSFDNENRLSIAATDKDTKEEHKLNTDIKLAPGYWKTVTTTLDQGNITLYVDGQYIDELKDTNFSFAGLGDVQRNYLGRSSEEAIAFFNGNISNFDMYSYAMTKDEVSDTYGDGSVAKINSVDDITLVTKVNEKPDLPEKVSALYGDGIYKEVEVVWDEVEEEKYAKVGSFDAQGKLTGYDLTITAHIYVVDSDKVNLASAAKATAIIDTPSDLGGVAGLNDEYEPTSSSDKSHGVWHNWQGNQNGEAWVAYTWDEEVILTGQDAYYYTDGNFLPASVELFYRNDEEEWVPIKNCKGLDTRKDQYNTTSFQPVKTTAIKMVMNPKTLGVGVIEWKVYGYQPDNMVNKSELKKILKWVNNISADKVEKDFDEEVKKELEEAIANADLSIDEYQTVMENVKDAFYEVEPKDGNYAYIADVETSFVSNWEKLSAVNDGELPKSSTQKTVSAYGSWGKTSEFETITYSFPLKITLEQASIYLWTDNGGIHFPKSYSYEYLDGDEWKEVEGVKGYEMKQDTFNITSFDKIQTKAIRVKLVKQAANNEGVGVFEWRISGKQEEIAEDNELVDIQKWINSLPDSYVEEGIDEELKKELKDAIENTELTTSERRQLVEKIEKAVQKMKIKDNNLAYIANVETSFVSSWEKLESVNDGKLPENSTNKTVSAYGSWGNESKEESITYSFPVKVKIDSASIYFWTDGGGIQFPTSYKFEYLDGETWKEVKDADGYGLKKDSFNATTFEQVTTKSIRLTMTKQNNNNNGVGVFEWTLTKEDEAKDAAVINVMEDIIQEETTKVEATEETTTQEDTSNVKKKVSNHLLQEKIPDDKVLKENATEDASDEKESSDTGKTEVAEETTQDTLKDVKHDQAEEEGDKQEEESEIVISKLILDPYRATELQEILTEKIGVPESEEATTLEDAGKSSLQNKTVHDKVEFQTGIAKTRLHASVMDDGYPNLKLSYAWKVVKAPAGAKVEFEYDFEPITNVTFDKVGEYELGITVSDGELESTDTVVITVKEDEEIPEMLASYNFSSETIDEDARIIKDNHDTGYDSRLAYNPNAKFKEIDGKTAIVMSGEFCGYVKLDSILTKGKVSKEKDTDKKSQQDNTSGKIYEEQNKNHQGEQKDSESSNQQEEQKKPDSSELLDDQKQKTSIEQSDNTSKHKNSSKNSGSQEKKDTNTLAKDTTITITDTTTPLSQNISDESVKQITRGEENKVVAKVQNDAVAEQKADTVEQIEVAGKVEKEVINTVEDKIEVDKKQEEYLEKVEEAKKEIAEESVAMTDSIEQNNLIILWIMLGFILAGISIGAVIWYRKKQ